MTFDIIKGCYCIGVSKAGFPFPTCAMCGKPWIYRRQLQKLSASAEVLIPTLAGADASASQPKEQNDRP